MGGHTFTKLCGEESFYITYSSYSASSEGPLSDLNVKNKR